MLQNVLLVNISDNVCEIVIGSEHYSSRLLENEQLRAVAASVYALK